MPWYVNMRVSSADAERSSSAYNRESISMTNANISDP